MIKYNAINIQPNSVICHDKRKTKTAQNAY